MKKRLFSLAAATAFLVMASPAPNAGAAAAKLPLLKTDSSHVVEVRRGHRDFRRGHAYRHSHVRRHRYVRPHYVHPRRYHVRRWHRGPRFSIYIGPRFRSCAWLRHRAIVTGSRYWWRRYRWCRGW